MTIYFDFFTILLHILVVLRALQINFYCVPCLSNSLFREIIQVASQFGEMCFAVFQVF